MDNFENEDINIFINSYKQHIIENPLLNSKIPMWVEYLKTKKHYKENGMEEDYFFKKRFRITEEDLITIHKLMNRIKKGKTLDKVIRTKVQGNDNLIKSEINLGIFSNFDENENYENKNNFELLDQVQDAMDSYYKKMKKSAEKKNWKQNKRTWDPIGTVANAPNRYYNEDIFSERPSIEFDVQNFARTGLVNMNKTNIIQKIDQINEILDHNDLISNDFDTEYKRSVPNIACSKKVSFSNIIDETITNTLNDDIGVQRFVQDQQSQNPQYRQNALERIWQNQDILGSGSQTRNTCVPNKNPFEHQFEYLDGNYNRVEDPRLIGQSSRLANRAPMNR